METAFYDVISGDSSESATDLVFTTAKTPDFLPGLFSDSFTVDGATTSGPPAYVVGGPVGAYLHRASLDMDAVRHFLALARRTTFPTATFHAYKTVAGQALQYASFDLRDPTVSAISLTGAGEEVSLSTPRVRYTYFQVGRRFR